MAAITICSNFGAPQNKVWHCFHCLPIYFPWGDGTRCHDLSFLNVGLQPTFSLSSFTFIKRLFSSSSLSALRVVSSAHLRLLMFLPAILIPVCASSSPAFLMMYSAYKLNKQGDRLPKTISAIVEKRNMLLNIAYTCGRWNNGPTNMSMGFLCSSAYKVSTCNFGNPSSIPALGRAPGEEID